MSEAGPVIFEPSFNRSVKVRSSCPPRRILSAFEDEIGRGMSSSLEAARAAGREFRCREIREGSGDGLEVGQGMRKVPEVEAGYGAVLPQVPYLQPGLFEGSLELLERLLPRRGHLEVVLAPLRGAAFAAAETGPLDDLFSDHGPPSVE